MTMPDRIYAHPWTGQSVAGQWHTYAGTAATKYYRADGQLITREDHEAAVAVAVNEALESAALACEFQASKALYYDSTPQRELVKTALAIRAMKMEVSK
jgi:hypothetical protein